ncbi:hypothetical protein BC829DRAFT_218026 [Chytridium lagenaria]|nr:hypothetical protein BC829DRAFT_218026 [Chytridium lagenaria]
MFVMSWWMKWASIKWVTEGTSICEVAFLSLAFRDPNMEAEYMIQFNRRTKKFCLFLLSAVIFSFLGETLILYSLMSPSVFRQVLPGFIIPIMFVIADVLVFLKGSKKFVDRWQHIILMPGTSCMMAILFIYFPYFTDFIEYRQSPVAFAYALLYNAVFGIAILPHTFCGALIMLLPISPVCWLLVTRKLGVFPLNYIATLSLYGSACVVTLIRMRTHESRQRRIFAIERELAAMDQIYMLIIFKPCPLSISSTWMNPHPKLQPLL